MSASPPAGLCSSCRHVRRVESGRGSTFFLCRRSRKDDRFPRYPRIPVHRCPGYERAEGDPESPSGPETDPGSQKDDRGPETDPRSQKDDGGSENGGIVESRIVHGVRAGEPLGNAVAALRVLVPWPRFPFEYPFRPLHP